MSTNNFQYQLFNDILGLKGNADSIAAYFQNDFERMLEDGYVTKEKLKKDRVQFDLDIERMIMLLETFQQKGNKLFDHIIGE